MNKFKSFVFGALFAVASVHTAFAERTKLEIEVLKSLLSPQDAAYIDQLSPAELELAFKTMDEEPAFKAQYEQALAEAKQKEEQPSQNGELLKKLKASMSPEEYAQAEALIQMDPSMAALFQTRINSEDREAASEAASQDPQMDFEQCFADYKKIIDGGNVEDILTKTNMYDLNKVAKTPEQEARFKPLYEKYNKIYRKAMEWDNANFASATANLLAKAKNAKNPEAKAKYIATGISLYDRYLKGDRKGKATTAQLKKCYDTFTAFMQQNPDVKVRNKFMNFPDGSEIPLPKTNIFIGGTTEVCGNKACYGKVTGDGEVYIVQGLTYQYLCTLKSDGYIYNKDGKQIGMLDFHDQIWINNKKRSYKEGGDYYLDGKKVGSMYGNGFNANGGKSDDLVKTASPEHMSLILFYSSIIPKK